MEKNAVNRVSVVITLLVLVWAVPLFASPDPVNLSPQKKQVNIQVHGSGKENTKTTMLDVLKKLKLENYPAKTIGQAFGEYSYFTKVEWKESPGSYAKTYVDLTARVKKKFFGLDKSWDGVAVRNLEVKFVMKPDGDFGVVMAARVDVKRDGTIERVPFNNLNLLLNTIYSNKEISF